MISYLIRRLLLFIPTIIGATFIVFMLMAAAPISIVEALLPPSGEMLPGQREEYEAYINERYGLNSPPPMQYLRWLNNISPIGLHTRKFDDPEVAAAREKRREWRRQLRSELTGEHPDWSEEQIEEEIKSTSPPQDLGPEAGQIVWNKVPVKMPDLGDSIARSRPVWPVIRESLPVSLLLNAIALPLALSVALITGIWAAKNRGLWQDWGTGGVLLALYSVPVIWVGVMLIGFLANVQFVKAFPAAGTESLHSPAMQFLPGYEAGVFQRGYLLDSLWHLALPVLCLSYAQFAYFSKLTRTSMLETLGSDYIRTARAKGLAPNVVLFRHAFRNSLIPLITFLAALMPLIITGSIVVETIFTINGMGRLVVDSIRQNDRELFLSVTLVIVILKLGAYLAADIAYVIADPRVSYEK